MKLSYRLETIASFVPKGSNVADIGTDHGYIPIRLIEHETAQSVIAMDISSGPLERAKRHIEDHHLSDKIQVRLSDGLKQLHPFESDCIIISGMGGELIMQIIGEGKHMWDCVRHWIFSPQSDLEKFRRYLEKEGFSIESEKMIWEDGKYYTVMKVCRGSMKYEKSSYYKYGKLLIQEKNPVLKAFLEAERKQIVNVLKRLEKKETEKSKERGIELQRELAWNQEALDEMQ